MKKLLIILLYLIGFSSQVYAQEDKPPLSLHINIDWKEIVNYIVSRPNLFEINSSLLEMKKNGAKEQS